MIAFVLMVMMMSVSVSVDAQCPAVINTPPASQTTGIGCSVSFNVNATGNLPLVYQWQFNGVEIGGAIGSTNTIPSVNAGTSGHVSGILT